MTEPVFRPDLPKPFAPARRTNALSAREKCLYLRISMRLLTSTLAKKETRRSLLAALFLIVFLAEAGSHAMICSNHTSSDRGFFSTSDAEHHDPCTPHVHCRDNQNERQLPGFSHDSMQHNALFDRPVDLVTETFIQRDPPIPYGSANVLFRPKGVPFQPPKLS